MSTEVYNTSKTLIQFKISIAQQKYILTKELATLQFQWLTWRSRTASNIGAAGLKNVVDVHRLWRPGPSTTPGDRHACHPKGFVLGIRNTSAKAFRCAAIFSICVAYQFATAWVWSKLVPRKGGRVSCSVVGCSRFVQLGGRAPRDSDRVGHRNFKSPSLVVSVAASAVTCDNLCSLVRAWCNYWWYFEYLHICCFLLSNILTVISPIFGVPEGVQMCSWQVSSPPWTREQELPWILTDHTSPQ